MKRRIQRLLRPKVLVPLGAAIVLAAGGLAAAVAHGLLFHDSSRPVFVTDALRRFRLEVPKPTHGEGVYLYATAGRESINVLGGPVHVYPAATTILLTRVPCGVQLRWEALQGHSIAWILCLHGLRVALRSTDEIHAFFGQTDRTHYLCDAGAAWPTGGPAGSRSAYTCRSARDRQEGVALMLGRVTLAVGGVRVEAVHVRTVANVSGRDSGTETVDWWLDQRTGVPLRIGVESRTSRRVLLVGTARYRESAELRLSSLTPLR